MKSDMSARKSDEGAAQKVSVHQWVRVILAHLLIPLVLLICGGDLGWWQAWLYSFMVVAAGVGGRIWAEQRHPGLTSERQSLENFQQAKSWDKFLAPLMAVSISFFVVIVAGIDHRGNFSLQFPLWINACGFLLVAFGYGLSAWAFAENRFFYSVVRIRAGQGHVVCESGPYRFVRHPGYAGSIVSIFGVVMALSSLWALISVVVALVVIMARTSLEDQALHEELPGYRDYARRVRYWQVPGVI